MNPHPCTPLTGTRATTDVSGKRPGKGKIPAKLAEEIPRKKLCVDIIGPYKICRKGREPLILKVVTMIYTVTGWFEITQYNDKKEMMMTNLVETKWLV